MGIALRWPIFWLTLRQFRAGKAAWATIGFAALPILLAVLFRGSERTDAPLAFLSGIFLNLVAPTILPLGTLILATTALGSEIEDRTLAYLTLKPLARLRIVLAKYLAALLGGGVVFAIGAWFTWLAIGIGQDQPLGWRSLLALLVAVVAGVAGYGALFLLISMIAPRALLIGIVYIIIWETTLARAIPNMRFLSVRYYVTSLYARLLDDPVATTATTARVVVAASVLVVLVVVSLALATYRLSRMDLD
jgi:ABC-2 type transport system permease protein